MYFFCWFLLCHALTLLYHALFLCRSRLLSDFCNFLRINCFRIHCVRFNLKLSATECIHSGCNQVMLVASFQCLQSLQFAHGHWPIDYIVSAIELKSRMEISQIQIITMAKRIILFLCAEIIFSSHGTHAPITRRLMVIVSDAYAIENTLDKVYAKCYRF